MQIKNKKYLILTVFLLITLSLFSSCGKDEEVTQTASKVAVSTVSADNGNITNTLVLSGQISANKTADVVPKVAGVVSSLSIKVGDSVKKGQTLFTLENGDYDLQVKQAQASYDLAQASYEDASRTYQRMQSLYSEGAISQSQLEQSSLAMEAANPAVAKAALDLAKSQYNNTIISSPMSGVVAEVNVIEGTIAGQQMASVSIVDIGKVKLTAGVSEGNINKLSVGQAVQVMINSASTQLFSGTVSSIAPTANAQTLTFPVEITIANSERLIKPGMFGEVKLETEKAENTLLIPLEALVNNMGSYRVFVVKNGIAKAVDVEVGMQDEVNAQITSGLIVGDRVVVSGQDRLQDGMEVVETVIPAE